MLKTMLINLSGTVCGSPLLCQSVLCVYVLVWPGERYQSLDFSLSLSHRPSQLTGLCSLALRTTGSSDQALFWTQAPHALSISG